jgi:hypothetical protein
VHGGLLPLTARVKRGQTLLLVNAITGEERECRVVYVESKRRNRKVGVEFTELRGDFWHVYSPLVEFRPRTITPEAAPSENPDSQR